MEIFKPSDNTKLRLWTPLGGLIALPKTPSCKTGNVTALLLLSSLIEEKAQSSSKKVNFFARQDII